MTAKKKYFGTDGIRGQANKFPMTADVAMRVAMATAVALRARYDGESTKRVVIGKDTRLSGYMIEEAMCAGFVSMGLEVILVGPIPTPGIAMLARSLRADIGVMISASHNKFQDNGIKLFGPDGYKLDNDLEIEIEERIDQDLSTFLAPPNELGKAKRLDDALGRYVEAIKRSLPRGETLSGLRVVVDCANGAAYKVAPQVLWELEADVIAIGVAPDGRNINEGCGATDTEKLQSAVIQHKADIGLALDGDADRLIMVDETGAVIDGDQLMAALALSMKRDGSLSENGLVATVMSNLGLERLMADNKIQMLRTAVGDRHVVEAMREGGYSLGGEQSGHMILSDYGTTGDGLLAGLQVLKILKDSGEKASVALQVFEPLPQLLRNVRFEKGQAPLEDENVRAEIAKAQDRLSGVGRVLVRASGTEPLIRVMAEGEKQDLIENVVDDLCQVIKKATIHE